jgi:hypothetical protein
VCSALSQVNTLVHCRLIEAVVEQQYQQQSYDCSTPDCSTHLLAPRM